MQYIPKKSNTYLLTIASSIGSFMYKERGRQAGDMKKDVSMSAGAPALMALSIAYPFVRAGRYANFAIP